MYVIKRMTDDTISYYTYDGWVSFPKEGPLDLTGVVRFTLDEALSNAWIIADNEEFQWYGAYKR